MLNVLDLKLHAFYVILILSSYIIPEEQKKQSNNMKLCSSAKAEILLNLFLNFVQN